MKKIKLKNTDLNISNIAMGTDSVGSLIKKDDSFALLDYYVAQGGNIIDTAEVYASWISGGEHASENTIGQWLNLRNIRNNVIISTKGAHFQLDQNHRLTKKDIFSDLEGSLKRLKTDYIDIYWMHRDSPEVGVEEIVDILTETVKQGKVRYFGMSNWTYDRIDKANQYAKKHGLPPIIASQIQYSAACPNIENNEPDLVIMNDKEYDYFKNHDLSVFAFAAQAKGFFSKYQLGNEEALSPKAYDRYLNAKTIHRYERLDKISREHNCSMGAIVLAALYNNYDFDTIPIIGCKTMEHLKDSLSDSDLMLTQEEMNYIWKVV